MKALALAFTLVLKPARSFLASTFGVSAFSDVRNAQVSFSLNYHGQQLIQDTDLSLAMGNRYGMIGLNGCGKSAMLTALGRRLVPIPEHISMYHVDQEAQPSDQTALETVLQDLDSEVAKLEAEYEELCETEPDGERCQEICDRLDELDPALAPARAGRILFGLGFDKAMQNTQVKHFSGGWRMRVALARALFVAPDLLIIEDPTSHLDLGAVVWLEEYLKNYPRILLITSHSQDFMNGVCTNIILLRKNKLSYYKGNYDTYVRTRAEQEENQQKLYKKQQEEIADIKDFIARFGHGTAKMVRQAQSREKVLKKMEEEGLIEPVENDRTSKVVFYDPAPLAPPVISLTQVSFGYSAEKMLYRRVDFGVDLDSRISIVGPNGAGKSTLFKLILGELQPSDGTVQRHSHLVIGHFHQHLSELLDPVSTPLDYMLKCGAVCGLFDSSFFLTQSLCRCYPMEREAMRRILGRYGINGVLQTRQISALSGGQKARLNLAWLAEKRPAILALDEPTNSLDIETIDALADAINAFKGGLLLISHDFRLISQVTREIWEVSEGAVTKWKGDIISYKAKMKKEVSLFLE